jgi:autotransporter-associated beta strand protein
LAGDNTFSGGVIVDAAANGLAFAANHINALGTGLLNLGAGAKATLNYVGDHNLPSLTLNGVVQPKGTYGSTASGASTVDDAHFAGTGTVTVGPKMLTFDFGIYGVAVITGTNIGITVPFGTDVTSLAPTYTTSFGATGDLASGSTQDFSSSKTYTLSSGSYTEAYVVTVSIAANTPPTLFNWITVGDGNWSGGVNWNTNSGNGLAPLTTGESDYVFNFNQAGIYTATQNLDVGFQLNQLNFGGSTATLVGNGLTLVANGAAMPQINQNSGVAVVVDTPLDLTVATTLGGSGGGAVTINGSISNMGSLTKTTSGTLTLSGANAYAGGTTISNGMLSVGAQTALGSGPVTLDGGTFLQQVNFEGFGAGATLANDFTLSGGLVNMVFNFSTTKDMTLGGVVSGAGGFHLSGAQRGLALAGDNTFSGGVIVDAAANGLAFAANHINALGTGLLSLGAGAKATLNYVGDHSLPSLTLNGVVQANGTYGSSTSGAEMVDDLHFAGTGTVTVGPHNLAKIRTFVFSGLPATTINDTNHTVQVTVPYGTDVTALAPTYTVSTAASSTPGSGTVADFTMPQSYSVTSGDATATNAYVVTVTVMGPPLVTVTGITAPVAGPGVGEFTVTMTGSSNFAGDVVVEQSTDLITWVTAQISPIPSGAFSIPIVMEGKGPKSFFRVKYP